MGCAQMSQQYTFCYTMVGVNSSANLVCIILDGI